MNKFTISLILFGLSTLIFLVVDWRKAGVIILAATVWYWAMTVESSLLSGCGAGVYIYLSYRLLRWVFRDARKGKAA